MDEKYLNELIDLADDSDTEALEDIEIFDMGDAEIDTAFDASAQNAAAEQSASAADSLQQARDALQEKYEEARIACKDMIERITYDMQQTNNNPYIRTTTTRRIEILRKSTDTEPVDVFEFEKTSGFSLRAIAISAAVVLAADVAAAILIKKKFF